MLKKRSISQVQVFHKPAAVSVSFDEPNLVAVAGLLPVMTLARDAGLQKLADERLTVPTDKGANAGLKLASLLAGMVAGADSIDDMALLHHGGMKRLFTACYPLPRWGRSCGPSRSAMSASWTLSPPASWETWPPGHRC